MRKISGFIIVGALLFSAEGTYAQGVGAYVGLAMGSAPSIAPTGFDGTRAAAPAGLFGFRFTAAHALELSVSWLRSKSTEDWAPSMGEAPYTRGIEAIPVSLTYRHEFSLPYTRFAPSVGIGAVTARLTDSFESDTPEERVSSAAYGGHVELGLRYKFASSVSAAAHVAYRHLERGSRPIAYELSGSLFSAGLQLDL